MTATALLLSPTNVAIGLAIATVLLIVTVVAQRRAIARARSITDEVRKQGELDAARLQEKALSAAKSADMLIANQATQAQLENERIREHYASVAKEQYEEALQQLRKAQTELDTLKEFASVAQEARGVRQSLTEAIDTAAALKADAEALMVRAQGEREKRRDQAEQEAARLLAHAHRESTRLLAQAAAEAEKTGGEAFLALREKDAISKALTAIRNEIDGYGDRYVVPTKSVLDDLASDYGHTQAGQALQLARAQSKRMVEEGEAAACDYVEKNRRETAIRFLLDAFNGRVDAILSRTRHDNIGTLEQEIRDAYEVVNLNGAAFRDAKILPAYLDARLSELKWAVAGQELRRREREEQRSIKERIREEEKARREYEKAIREAEEQEVAIKSAMERARTEAEHASAGQRARYEEELARLTAQLAEAEARNQRALSMAQQTRAGHVYIISNVGSFGEQVVKIGMTRRLEPSDRIKELGDASVPFEFDVHAMIYSEDAPELEALLHAEFDDARINRVNNRKEFFRVPLERVREVVAARKLEASFTILAEAQEWKESQALARSLVADAGKRKESGS